MSTKDAVKFCPQCQNMLRKKRTEEKKLVFFCHNCGYEEDIKAKSQFKC